MPTRRKTLTTGIQSGVDPFVGPVDYTVPIPVLLTQFSANEIDADGYLKAAIPLTRLGVLIAGSPAFVFGVTVAPVKVADDNASATIAALGTVDITVAPICMVNRDLAVDILGRAYTANEIAGFDRAGSKCVLLYIS